MRKGVHFTIHTVIGSFLQFNGVVLGSAGRETFGLHLREDLRMSLIFLGDVLCKLLIFVSGYGPLLCEVGVIDNPHLPSFSSCPLLLCDSSTEGFP